MTILNTGSTRQYADNWAKAFGTGASTRKAAKSKLAAKKKAGPKKKKK